VLALHDPVVEPLYVPVIDVDEAVPLPEAIAEQPANGPSKPPVGTVNVNCSDVPDMVPETDPRPVTFVVRSVIVSDPENDESDCVSCQVMVPGPVESLALPLHVPFTFAGVDG
jgi:hypothetical protein